ncbi:MAG: aspartate aminotransferase family protein [Flavobacterium sp.]|nr:aspartate aminotransferase family protein [Pedobacter sp.]
MLTQRQLFLLNTAQTSDSPKSLEITKAEGIYLYDITGKKFIDLVSGFAVSNVGHRHPKVVQAIKDQADKYLHLTVYGEYIQSPQVLFAEKLCSILPKSLNSVYFVNSGAEATEGAMKLAKRFTGRVQIISCINSYHGSTQGALSLMGNEYYKQSFRPLLPGVRYIRYNIEKDIELINFETAAVFLETIQGEAGVIIPDYNYMQVLRKRCAETGTLLVLDEIQTGFGRTGELFGFEHYNIIPDIILLAKGMGGGMPIGAFIANKMVMDSLKENPVLGHITTFGGHPVSCAAGLAALNVLLDNKLAKKVDTKEHLFRKYLTHPKIIEIRGKGLLLAIQLSSFTEVEEISKTCLEKGLIIDWFLHNDTSLRIAPPLTITPDQIKEACAIILNALK